MKQKSLIFHDAARDRIRRGVDALAEAVSTTVGPVNSGVLVAEPIELSDPFEDMGAQLLRYQAGGMNPMHLKRGIEAGTETIVAEIRRIAEPCTKPCTNSVEISHVAAISANSDRETLDERVAKLSGVVALHTTRAAFRALSGMSGRPLGPAKVALPVRNHRPIKEYRHAKSIDRS